MLLSMLPVPSGSAILWVNDPKGLFEAVASADPEANGGIETVTDATELILPVWEPERMPSYFNEKGFKMWIELLSE